MKIKATLKAFTLIELLVVITIIGILATGATTVYTSQIQKARDSTRLTDVKALQGGIEQFYQDIGEYPAKGATFSGVTVYVPKLPTDPKSKQASGNSIFEYLYSVSADSNTILNQEYEVSTHFEQAGNLSTKAVGDGGDDDFRMENGINVSDTSQATVVALAGGIAAGAADWTCLSPTGSADTACNTPANPMLIRSY